MSADIEVAGPRPRAYLAGWGWLLLTTVSRFYLVFLGSLAACALLPMLAGLSGAVIQSGSMAPHINTGDVVLSRSLPATAPVPMGRVITFRAPAGSAHSGDVLHRLVATNEDGSLETAGDANATPDSTPLARGDIISQARLLIPWIGLPGYWIATGALTQFGIWLLLTMCALMVGAVDAASRPPDSPGGPSRPISPDSTGKAHQATLPRGKSISSLVHRMRNATGTAAVALVAVLTAAALATTPLGLAAAAFNARATSAGNLWGTAGPAARLAFTTDPSGSTGGTALATQPVVAVQTASGDAVTVSDAEVTLSITTLAGATLACTSNPLPASSGVATFAGCKIDKAGTYTLTAASDGLTRAVSTDFTIATGPASTLAFTTDPSGVSTDVPFAPQPVVAAHDAGGNPVVSSDASVTLSITPPTGGAILSCAVNPKSAVAGVATFAGCSIDTPGTYTLTAASGELTSAVSAPITLVAGSATRLAFITNPSSSTGGTAFGTQPVVAVQDSDGNTVTSSSAAVSLSITTPAGAVLTCTANPKDAVSGVATFAGCRVDKIGTYTLTAISGGLTNAVSASFTISVGPAVKLGFTRVPSSTRVNTAFASQPRVAIQDAGGNTRSSSSASVLLAITPPPGGASLTSCSYNPRSTSSGVASFSSCRINTAGTYTLTATASGLTSAVTPSIVIFGTATKLAFSTSPSSSTGSVAFPTQPVVAIQDAGGRTTTGTNSVTLAITAPTGGAALTCTTNPRSAAAGLATFASCRINKAGTYTLTATATGLTSAVSANFSISVGPATKLAFTTSPSSSTGGIPFATQPVLKVQDAGGNTVTTSTASVNLSITTPAGAVLTCTQDTLDAVAGLASFQGCAIDKIGTYTLTAVSSGLSNAVSASHTISVGPAVKLGFTRSPTDTAVDTGFALQPMVAIQDAGGNTRTASSASVTLTITPPTGGATLTCSSNPRTTSYGVASFSSCQIDTAGTYTLTATASELTAGISSSFTITAGGDLAAAQGTPPSAPATPASSAPAESATSAPAPKAPEPTLSAPA